jgi:hypothetical protein
LQKLKSLLAKGLHTNLQVVPQKTIGIWSTENLKKPKVSGNIFLKISYHKFSENKFSNNNIDLMASCRE